ncbi:glutaredoxin family protein [Motiliproteus coralliicola]|uniref:Glutaredoxin family protein n=1 Tax=Motiliproteus coralliicola TaxID=2283196 RepID=A0A369WCZ0_9GAMM|nr:glutaredoxin family protein [Motiliproteus coralliicola]RDE19898.1 glutaredoxin family protein [Motiliproteus coralliicola]
MKKLLWLTVSVAVITAVYLGRGHIHAFLVQAPDFAAQHEEPVILYGTSWCPYCDQTKVFLERNEIPYYEYNIEVSSEGYHQYKQLNGQGTPLLLINKQVIRGYNPPVIMEVLTKGSVTQTEADSGKQSSLSLSPPDPS